MNRAVTVIAVFSVWLLPLFSASAQDRPNILVIMAEDMSSRVGAFGDEVAITPNLDALAQSGVRFTNTFTTAGVCAPSRASHIMGMHQISLGAQHMRSSGFKPTPYRAVPPASAKAYPELLRHAGYFTLTNQKIDYQFSHVMAGTGPFTIWDYEGKKPDWNLRAPGQPFYALINLLVTHESQLFEKSIERNRANGLDQVVSPSDVEVPPYYPDTPAVRSAIAQHYDNIHAMDKQAGELLEKLRQDGLSENTIVIWTTDHGDGFPRAKRELYDSGIKVPMIIHWPEAYRSKDFKAGSEDRRLISFIDFAPSILGLAGVDAPASLQGVASLFDKSVARDYVYASKDRIDEFPFRERAIRDEQFKYIRNYKPGMPGGTHLRYRDQLNIMKDLWHQFESDKMNDQQAFWFMPRPAEELYDVINDPHEVNNLAGNAQYAEVLVKLNSALDKRLAEIGDQSDQPEQTMMEQFWPDGRQPITPTPRIIPLDNGRLTLQATNKNDSLGYRIDKGLWRAYKPNAEIQVKRGSTLSAKAVRYGWKESAVVTSAK